MTSKLTPTQFDAIVDAELPFAQWVGYRIDTLEAGHAVITVPYRDVFVRPGGTIAGPVQMLLADLVMYAVVLSLIGPVELAVTTNLNCNFLRRPKPTDLIGEGRIMKLGKRLAVGEVSIYSAGDTQPVAHVTSTYSIPPASTPLDKRND